MKSDPKFQFAAFDDERVEPVKVPRLSLEDTISQTMRGVKAPHSRNGSGYNPYDTFPNTSSTGAFARHKDLRQLSQWIRAKRQVEELKKVDEEE
jgi:hypothetical protein